MEIVDTLRISASKYLQIIRVGDKYFAIAVCKDTVTMLTEVSKDSLNLEMGAGNTNLSFREVLEKIKDSTKVLQDTKKQRNNIYENESFQITMPTVIGGHIVYVPKYGGTCDEYWI